MVETTSELFTVGVFQDVVWAEKGLQALRAQRFPVEALSLIAKDSPDVMALSERVFGAGGSTLDIRGVGSARVHGPIVEALQRADRGLTAVGIAATAGRIGFQAHDGRIFETLVARGGVLVAIHTEARASDALEVLHSYGGGNAAIGAWIGRI